MKHVLVILCLVGVAGCDMKPGLNKERIVEEVVHCQAIEMDAEFINDDWLKGVDTVRCLPPVPASEPVVEGPAS